ncbi:MAG: response regulator [Pseudanabaenaceae cyanobacterium]
MYKAEGGGSLVKVLLDLEQSQYTGTVKLGCEGTSGKRLVYFGFYQSGHLNFASSYVPTNRDLIHILARHLKLGYIDSLLEYVSRRVDLAQDSAYEVLSTLVSTKAVLWEDIEKVFRQKVISVLERLMPHTCKLDLEEDLKLQIGFGPNCSGFSAATLIEELTQRQEQWKKLIPSINSLEDIPIIREGALHNITHQPTLTHLQTWVDGKRSIADIAEALDQNPLAIASLYFNWLQGGLIEIVRPTAVDPCPIQSVPVILSVDDSPIVQSMIRKSLQPDYEVICADSAMEALGILNRCRVDLIVLDVTMPEIDGFEFCRTIRKINKFKNIPVIMLTAKDGLIDRAKGHLSGTNRYLTKPINKEELIKVIKEYV